MRTIARSIHYMRSAGPMPRWPALWLGALALTMGSSAVRAADAEVQNWPQRPITLVVPIAAGGGTDIIARGVADKLAAALGQPIVVRNQPGANGTIGTSAVARAPADGYTIMVGSIGTHAANVCLYDLPYDADKDFTPVALLALYNNVFIVRQDSPIKSLADLVRRAKAEPGKLTYAITVIGSSSHLSIEKFKLDAKLDILGVPYNGAVPATVDLMGGRIDFMLDTVVSQFGSISAGKVRALATTMSSARSSVLPDVPSVAEQGYPQFDTVGWTGLFVPAGTPEPILRKIAITLKQVYDTGEVQKLLGSKGLDVTTTTPQAFAQFVAKERKTWCDVIHSSNIKIN